MTKKHWKLIAALGVLVGVVVAVLRFSHQSSTPKSGEHRQAEAIAIHDIRDGLPSPATASRVEQVFNHQVIVRVRSSEGATIPGVEVDSSVDGTKWQMEGSTDGSGERLMACGDNDTPWIMASKAGFQTCLLAPAPFADPGKRVVEITLRTDQSITVRVMTLEDSPVESPRLKLISRWGKESARLTDSAQADHVKSLLNPFGERTGTGEYRFAIGDLPYRLAVEADGYVPAALDIPRRGKDRTEVVAVRLRALYAGGVVRPRYPAGNPTMSEFEMMFHWRDGEIGLSKNDPDLDSIDVEGILRATEERFGLVNRIEWIFGVQQRPLAEAPTLEVNTRFRGGPGKQVSVGLHPIRELLSADLARPFSDVDASSAKLGEVVFRFVDSTNAVTSSTRDWFVLRAGTDAALGRVVCSSRQLRSEANEQRATLLAGDYEAYSLPGDPRFGYQCGRAEFETTPFTVTAYEVTAVVIALPSKDPSRCSLRLHGNDRSGRRLSDWSVMMLRPKVIAAWTTRPDESGALSCDDLEAGRYRLLVCEVGYRPAKLDVELVPGKSADVEFELTPSDDVNSRIDQATWLKEINEFSATPSSKGEATSNEGGKAK